MSKNEHPSQLPEHEQSTDHTGDDQPAEERQRLARNIVLGLAGVALAANAHMLVNNHQQAQEQRRLAGTEQELVYELENAYKDPAITAAEVVNMDQRDKKLAQLRVNLDLTPNPVVAEADHLPDYYYDPPVAVVRDTDAPVNRGDVWKMEREKYDDGQVVASLPLSMAKLDKRGGREEVDIYAATKGFNPENYDEMLIGREYAGTVYIDNTSGQMKVTFGEEPVTPEQAQYIRTVDRDN
jgi:hypothetical protein